MTTNWRALKMYFTKAKIVFIMHFSYIISYLIPLHNVFPQDIYIQQSTYSVGYLSCSRYWCNWCWPPPLSLLSMLPCIFRHLKSYTDPLMLLDQSTNRLRRSHYRSHYFYQAKEIVPKQIFLRLGFLHKIITITY